MVLNLFGSSELRPRFARPAPSPHSHRAADAMGRADRARRGLLLPVPSSPASWGLPARLALAALLCTGIAGAANADVLITNFGTRIGPSTTLGSGADHATSFTTGGGANARYGIEQIDLVLGGISSDDQMTVTLRSNFGGKPGVPVVNFTHGALANGVNTFLAPAGAVINGNTTYWVTVHQVAGSFTFATTKSDQETHGHAGWSIGNTAYRSSDGIWGPFTGDTLGDVSHGIRVIGTKKRAPTSADARVSTEEDTPYVFTLDEFAFGDADLGDQLAHVVLAQEPSAGQVQVNGNRIRANRHVSRSDVEAGRMTYRPGTNDRGTRTFRFRVADADGLSSARHTMTIDVSPVDDPPTGTPTIAGTAQIGTALGADTSEIEDVDGLSSPDWRYQWVRQDHTSDDSATDITGATSATYTPNASDLLKYVRVKIRFTDDGGTTQELSSTPAGPVLAAPGSPQSPAQGLVWIRTSDVRFAGATVEAARSGVRDPNGLTHTQWHWQWLRMDDAAGTNTVAIPKATSESYTLHPDDIGKWIAVRLRFTDDAGTLETLTSAPIEGPTGDIAAPSLESAHVNAEALTIAWNERLERRTDCRSTMYYDDCGRSPLAAALTVTAGGTIRAVTELLTREREIRMRIDPPAAYGQTVHIFYIPPPTTEDRRIRDRARNPAPPFQTFVENRTPRPTPPRTKNGLPIGRMADMVVSERDGTVRITVEFGTRLGKDGARFALNTGQGTARANDDYIPVSEMVSVPAWRSRWSKDIDIVEDFVAEETEQFTVNLGSPVGGSVGVAFEVPEGSPLATITILDDGRTRPGPVQALSATPGNQQVTLRWTRGDAGDTALRGYDVRRKTATTTTWSNWSRITGSNSGTTSHTETGLTNGTLYDFEIRPVSHPGPSEARGISATPRSAATANVAATGQPVMVDTITDPPAPNTPDHYVTYYEVDLPLTASLDGLADANGLPTTATDYTWQWLADAEPIAGATSNTYTPTADDLGKRLAVQVSFADDDGYTETVRSIEGRPVDHAFGTVLIGFTDESARGVRVREGETAAMRAYVQSQNTRHPKTTFTPAAARVTVRSVEDTTAQRTARAHTDYVPKQEQEQIPLLTGWEAVEHGGRTVWQTFLELESVTTLADRHLEGDEKLLVLFQRANNLDARIQPIGATEIIIEDATTVASLDVELTDTRIGEGEEAEIEFTAPPGTTLTGLPVTFTLHPATARGERAPDADDWALLDPDGEEAVALSGNRWQVTLGDPQSDAGTRTATVSVLNKADERVDGGKMLYLTVDAGNIPLRRQGAPFQEWIVGLSDGDANNFPWPPRAPFDFAVAPGNQQVRLSWEPLLQEEGASGWEYRWGATDREGIEVAWNAWTAISNARWSTRAHTVTGLTNDTLIAFQVRAVPRATGVPKGVPTDKLVTIPSAGSTSGAQRMVPKMVGSVPPQGGGKTSSRRSPAQCRVDVAVEFLDEDGEAVEVETLEASAFTVENGQIGTPVRDANGMGWTVPVQASQGVDGIMRVQLRETEQWEAGEQAFWVGSTCAPAERNALAALSLEPIALHPAFTAHKRAYTASTQPGTDEITAAATPIYRSSTVTITPEDADPETPEHEVALDEGENQIAVTVTPGDGSAAQTYTVTVTRPSLAGVLTRFVRVDAATDADLGDVAQGDTFEVADGASYGFRAETRAQAHVGSVVLALSGPQGTHEQTENKAPYSLYGDASGAERGRELAEGTYTLTATAYAEAGASGAVLGTRTVSFTATQTPTGTPPVTPPVAGEIVTALVLSDASDQSAVATLADNAAVDLGMNAGSYAIEAQIAPDAEVGSVALALSGTKSVSKTENKAPYSLYGDTVAAQGERALNGASLPAGTYTLTATAYAEAGASGAVLGARSASFTVLNPPALSVADAETEEAANAKLAFKVSLNRAAKETVTVDYATSDDTATAAEDYTAASGTLTFAIGETRKSVAVTVLDDPHDEGKETLTLTLSNARGATIADGEATGTIKNTDPMPKALAVRFGRTAGEHLVEALDNRLSSARGSHASVAGADLLADQAWTPQREGEESAGPEREMTLRDLVIGSHFHLESERGEPGSAALSAWGRFARSGFDAEEDEVTLDGDVTSGILGADAEWDRLLAGVMLSWSTGDGSYRSSDGAGEGTAKSTVAGVYPYARLSVSERVAVWGIAGAGSGDLTLTPRDKDPMRTDLDLRVGALGVRGEVLDGTGPSKIGLNVRSDALWTETRTSKTDDLIATRGSTTRLRLIAEVDRVLPIGEFASLTPRGEIGVRIDGGDAETGTGIELGAGASYTAGALSIETKIRTLVAHEAEGYEEWGASAALRLNPSPSGRGLTLSITPTWGSAEPGAEHLWSTRPDAHASAREAERRLEAEIGYGLGRGHTPGVITPYVSASLGGSETWRTGAQWAITPEVNVQLEGARTDAGENEHDHALMLRARATW